MATITGSNTERLEQEEILNLILEELRIIYNRLDESQHTLKNRALTILGAALALGSYLYSGGDLFIPTESYGKVFYYLGLGLFISSICFLLQAVRPNPWAVPIEDKLNKLSRNKTMTSLLNELVENYQECMRFNLPKYERKVYFLSSGFYQLLCGGILLLVIKSIGG